MMPSVWVADLVSGPLFLARNSLLPFVAKWRALKKPGENFEILRITAISLPGSGFVDGNVRRPTLIIVLSILGSHMSLLGFGCYGWLVACDLFT